MNVSVCVCICVGSNIYVSLCCVCVSMCVNLYSLVWICFVYVFECVYSRLCKLREYMCVCVYVCALKYVCKSEVRFLFYRVFGKNYNFRNNFEKISKSVTTLSF